MQHHLALKHRLPVLMQPQQCSCTIEPQQILLPEQAKQASHSHDQSQNQFMQGVAWQAHAPCVSLILSQPQDLCLQVLASNCLVEYASKTP